MGNDYLFNVLEELKLRVVCFNFHIQEICITNILEEFLNVVSKYGTGRGCFFLTNNS